MLILKYKQKESIMISIKKLSLCGLLLAGSGSILGMESRKPARSLFSKLRKGSKTPGVKSTTAETPGVKSTAAEDKSAKLASEFDTLMNDLYAIAGKIKDPNQKRGMKKFLDRRRDRYAAIIPLSNKLESTIDKIYPLLQQEIGDEQQVSMVIDTLENSYGPSKLQSKIAEDIGGKGWGMHTIYEYIDNAETLSEDHSGLLGNETQQVMNQFKSKDVGTLYNAMSHPREKDVQTVAIEDVLKK